MFPLLFAAFAAVIGWSVGRSTKGGSTSVSGDGLIWVNDHWERPRTALPPGNTTQSAIALLMQLVNARMPVSPGLANAAYQEAMRTGDIATAQQIAVVFFPPQSFQQAGPVQPPPIMVGENLEDLEETYGNAEPANAINTSVIHNPPSPIVQDVSPDEWRDFVLCFKTRTPDYRGERHIGAFEHASRRLSQLGIDPASLTTEDSQYQALDKDLSNYLTTSESLINDFVGDTVDVNGNKVPVTRSGVLSLLKAAGPAGAKGWLTEGHQRKKFANTTDTFLRGNGKF